MTKLFFNLNWELILPIFFFIMVIPVSATEYGYDSRLETLGYGYDSSILTSEGGTTITSSGSSFNITYNRLLGQDCPTGQVLNGTYFNGTFKCTAVSSSGDNSSWNESYANTKYYLKTNPENYINLTTSAIVNTSRLLNQNCQSGYVVNGTFSNGTLRCVQAVLRTINNNFTTSQTIQGIVTGNTLTSLGFIYGRGDFISAINLTGRNIAFKNEANVFTQTNYFKTLNLGQNSLLNVSNANFNSTVHIISQESACLGTPSVIDCTIYGTNETACEERQSHGGCSWSATGGDCIDNPGLDCSGYDEANCLSRETVCNTNYDSSCTDNPTLDCSTMSYTECGDTYGSGCARSWGYSDCTGASGCEGYATEGDCLADPQAYGGCSANYNNYLGCTTTGSCSSFSSGGCPTSYGCQVSNVFNSCTTDGTQSCAGQSYGDCINYNGCLWNSSYSCAGTASCSITNKSTCLNETGCQWLSPAPNIILGSYKTANITKIYFDGNDTQFLSNGAMYFPNSSLYAKGFNTLSKVYDKDKYGNNSLALAKDSSYYKKPDGTLNYTLHPAFEQVIIEGKPINTLSMETRMAIMEQQIYDLKRCALMTKFDDMRLCILGG